MSTPRNIHAIRELAHRLWEARGRREGHAMDDWLDAERQLNASQDSTAPPDVTRKRPRKRSKSASAKPSVVPIDDAASTTPETPKVGSRDAPGG